MTTQKQRETLLVLPQATSLAPAAKWPLPAAQLVPLRLM
jgi:hypothetical protein